LQPLRLYNLNIFCNDFSGQSLILVVISSLTIAPGTSVDRRAASHVSRAQSRALEVPHHDRHSLDRRTAGGG
jgi:hypothetical protein